jgi:prepilin-type N-terminal cleavage/methylation domain-containing protein
MRSFTIAPRGCARSAVHVGFTLIEVLVVVAIIALLVSILLPSLASARNQAKLTMDMANMKQVATSVATYQTEYKNFVPVMYNDAANNNTYKGTAKVCWLSVAMRRYATETRKLGVRVINGTTYDFDPDKVWSSETRLAYEQHILPEVYACPFDRDRPREADAVNDQAYYRVYRKQGRRDSIQTWMWEYIIKGQLPPNGIAWKPTPSSPAIGVPKYTAFSWNCVRPSEQVTFSDGTVLQWMSNASAASSKSTQALYRKWSDGDLKRLRSGSFSTTAVAYCAMGESILGGQGDARIGWANPGSHPNAGAGGGTTVMFADTHVEWVMGKQIGWY